MARRLCGNLSTGGWMRQKVPIASRERQEFSPDCNGWLSRLFASDAADDWTEAPPLVREIAEQWREYRRYVPREAARRLFLHVRRNARRLLRDRFHTERQRNIQVLFRLASQDHLWIRAPEGWHPTGKSDT